MVSKALITSAKTTPKKSNRVLYEFEVMFSTKKDPPGHPVSEQAPNCTGVPSIFRIY